jgi:alpha-ketoglutarate-dependent taurine dioxygenase
VTLSWLGDDLRDADWLRPLAPDEPPTPALVEPLLRDGPGFVVVRGVPVPRDEQDAARWLVDWCGQLGEVIPQGADGRLVDRVRDERRATTRGAHTARALIHHTDMARLSPDVFALLAVRTSAAGGDSLIVSGPAVHAALRATCPEAADTLTEPWLVERDDDAGAGSAILAAPVFTVTGGVDVAYNRARIHRAYRLSGRDLPDRLRRALDALDDLLDDARYALRIRLAPRDLLVVNNRTVLHGRTGFTDDPRRGTTRLLLRVWIRRRPDGPSR